MAHALGLDPTRPPVDQVVSYCRAKIEDWVECAGKIETLAQLEQVVCDHISLLIEEVHTDSDLADLVRRYVAEGEPVFCAITNDLDEETFAALVERRTRPTEDTARYVAVIDCRGVKGARRFFTRWHEVAHLLTLTGQLELPFHRSTVKGDPIERLMDVVAGQIGFYEPIMRPAILESLRNTGRLSFAGVEALRRTICPDASFHATLIACATQAPVPVVQVTAGLGLKTGEAKMAESGQTHMFSDMEPVPKLRALMATQNDAARKARLRIDRNMEIPEGSTIWSLFYGDDEATEAIAIENLSDWTHSSGKALGNIDVCIEACRIGEEALALIQPS